MAILGVGFRFAADVLCEVSLHLLQPIVYTTATAFAQGGYGDGGYGEGEYGNPVGSLLSVVSQGAMYAGALVVVGWGLPTQEVATVTAVNNDGTVGTSALVNAHNAGETVLAPTFPSQQPTDPIFTQSEMLGYLSRAQNEFLTDCPVNYALSQQNLVYGQIFQNTPANCIEINRVAAAQYYSPLVSLSRAANLVTATTQTPHGLLKGSTFFVQSPNAGFGGVFQVATVLSPTSFTYLQIAANGLAMGGALLYFTRLYETTQAEITMTDRTWRNDYVGTPTQWFEDRAGLYRWGTGGKPASNFPVELLCSIRDTDALGLLDGFLVPDTLAYLLKYKVLEYAFGKNGVQQDASREAWCRQRYERGVMAVNRFIVGTNMGLKAGA